MAKQLNFLEDPEISDFSLKKESEAHIKRVIEALLFATDEPLSLVKLRAIIETKQPIAPRHLKRLMDELQDNYISERRAFRLEEVAQGYILRTCSEYSPYLNELYRDRRREKLSPAATETLAIIAHKAPITRAQIDAIRGVDSSGTLAMLLERGLVEIAGQLEAPGRPLLYRPSPAFSKYFGLKKEEKA